MKQNKRINIIDEARGLLIILVALYHLFFDLAVIYKLEPLQNAFAIMRFMQPVLPFMFILISGISFQLSRSNIKRGIILGIIAVCITLITWAVMPEYIILFGILHFLALVNIIFGLLKKFTDKIPVLAGVILCVLLFVLTYNIQRGYIGINAGLAIILPEFLYKSNALMILGFHKISFVSADYVPLLPWIFVFILGTIAGRFVGKMPESLKKTHIRPLAFLGRHTLIIYIIHQPLIYTLLQLIIKR